ncbi:MAG: flagellar basal body rod protein FlgC [candidate division Zixibacteria bacterium]|nr:flagellar basal body rod protein FlgC [candidate division Zixibacteria bacterium]
MSNLFSSLKISGSGLSVFRRKMNIAAENLANAETTKTDAGKPYQKKVLQISAKPTAEPFAKNLQAARVELSQTDNHHLSQNTVSLNKVENIAQATSEEYVDRNEQPRMIYDPSHPDADEDGFVAMPNVDPLIEMVEMMTASRAYEANISALQTTKTMTSKALDI